MLPAARLAVALGACCAAAAAAQHLALSIDNIEAPAFSARALKVELEPGNPGTLALAVEEVNLHGQRWRNVRLTCTSLHLEKTEIRCAAGTLDAGEKWPVVFSYSMRRKTFELALSPTPQERWRLSSELNAAGREFRVTIEDGRLARLAPWLPGGWPRINAGTVSGTLLFTGAPQLQLSAGLDIRGASFSDAAGLHAGEKVAAGLELEARQTERQWQGHAAVTWKDGEVFWQPLYFTGRGQRLIAKGAVDESQVRVEHANVTLPGVGEVRLDGTWDRRSGTIAAAGARAAKLDFGAFYAQILKPFLERTVLSDLRTEGEVALEARLEGGGLAAVDVRLADVSVEDRQRRFALFGVSGRIPWRRDGAAATEIRLKGGELLRLPFGAFALALDMRGLSFALKRAQVPLLDGALTVNDFAAALDSDGWRWQFSGALSPVSMERITQAVDLPVMHGSLSGVIPVVTYARSTLEVGGALLFRVFDGTVVAKGLTLLDPLGRAPRLKTDLEMRNLDLDLLTRTFSFGSITGRVDVEVRDLELAGWRPVKFDARIGSSPGEYPRRISQTAVQNISALGGAGAAGAIQRSFLRFFDQFGYEKLGLACRLANGVCAMGGVEDAPQGYVIVKGGGIPALTVLGYNRSVNWEELLNRLTRIMQDNPSAIVR
ncbi:MAG: hypothetical protein HY323_18635 [Betaproteobacteria bacterium]|nr:hypothetical protein [Betaproteobacteria bacterium]